MCDFSSVLRHFSRKFCLSQAIVYFRIANVSNKIAQTAFYANNNKKKNRSSTHRVFHSTALNLYLHTHSRTQTHADGVKWEKSKRARKPPPSRILQITLCTPTCLPPRGDIMSCRRCILFFFNSINYERVVMSVRVRSFFSYRVFYTIYFNNSNTEPVVTAICTNAICFLFLISTNIERNNKILSEMQDCESYSAEKNKNRRFKVTKIKRDKDFLT